MKAARSN